MINTKSGDYVIQYYNINNRVIIGLQDRARTLTDASNTATNRLNSSADVEITKRPIHYAIARVIFKSTDRDFLNYINPTTTQP